MYSTRVYTSTVVAPHIALQLIRCVICFFADPARVWIGEGCCIPFGRFAHMSNTLHIFHILNFCMYVVTVCRLALFRIWTTLLVVGDDLDVIIVIFVRTKFFFR